MNNKDFQHAEARDFEKLEAITDRMNRSHYAIHTVSLKFLTTTNNVLLRIWRLL
jgi:hypothetical protein